MKLFKELAEDFQSFVEFFQLTPTEDIVKTAAVSYLVYSGIMPADLVSQTPLEEVKISGTNKELDYTSFLKTRLAGVSYHEFCVDGATSYDAIINFQKNIHYHIFTFNLLEDDLSRKTVLYLHCYRMVPVQFWLTETRVGELKYYRPELIPESKQGVLLDCGGFDGKTALEYIDVYGEHFKRIYVFEPDPGRVEVCQENTKGYDNIVCLNKGVSNTKGMIPFQSNAGSAANRINEQGNIQVELVALDEEITEPVTFVKMDVEGNEKEALQGCKDHIQKDRPHLAICVSHLLEEMFLVPIMLSQMVSDYVYNIRFHGYQESPSDPIQPWNIVLYASPSEKIHRKSQKKEAVASIWTHRPFLEGQFKAGLTFQGKKLSSLHPDLLALYQQEFPNHDVTLEDLLKQSQTIVASLATQSPATLLCFYNLLEGVTSHLSQHIHYHVATYFRVEFVKVLDELWEEVIDKVPFTIKTNSLNIYTPRDLIRNFKGHSNMWENVALMKGFGLIGYTLGEEINGTPYLFFCSSQENYPYDKDLPLQKLIYHDPAAPPQMIADYEKFLRENYQHMDILIVNGPYDFGVSYLKKYKTLRPDGLVYCALDMNSSWKSTIDWNSHTFREFAQHCDVVSHVCTPLRNAMNADPNIHFTCRFQSNALYNPSHIPVVAEAKKKENILLTVARIGTAQKRNEDMMEAFALVAEQLGDWKLKLVGSIEPGFHAYIKTYFQRYPHLIDRVLVTGPIYEKEKLYEEYAKARIFILTSRMEGGSPNVYAEALHHGCQFICSSFDAADMIIKNGELGMKYPIGDISALTQVLLKMCVPMSEEDLNTHIKTCQAYGERYFDWGRNAKKLAFALFESELAKNKKKKHSP